MTTPIPVTPKLLQWIDKCGHPRRQAMSELVYQRDVFGQNKYGRALHAHDPYDFLEETKQELGDAAQYMFALVLEGKSLQSLRPYLEMLLGLVDECAVHAPDCDLDEDCTCALSSEA